MHTQKLGVVGFGFLNYWFLEEPGPQRSGSLTSSTLSETHALHSISLKDPQSPTSMGTQRVMQLQDAL